MKFGLIGLAFVVGFPLFARPSAQCSSLSAQAEAQQGLAAFQRGDFPAAEQHLSAALKADPNLPNAAEVEANLGLVYYATQRYPQAAEAFQSALKRDPSLELAKGFLPVTQAAAGDCAHARAGLEREFASNSDAKLRRILGLSLE